MILKFFKLQEKILVTGLVFVSFLPVLVGINSTVNNDSLVMFLSTMAILFLLIPERKEIYCFFVEFLPGLPC